MTSTFRLLAVLALCAPALSTQAATVPPEVVAVNERACVQLSSIPRARAMDKFAPADDAKIPAYCHCYSKAYWDSVPQADFDGMMAEHASGQTAGPHSLAIRAAVHDRNEAAKKSCR